MMHRCLALHLTLLVVSSVAPLSHGGTAPVAVAWPDELFGPKTKVKVAAAKRAAADVACLACTVISASAIVFTETVLEFEAIKARIDDGSLSEVFEDSHLMCNLERIRAALLGTNVAMETKPGKRAVLLLNRPNYTWMPPEGMPDDTFSWQLLAVQEACTGIFRNEGDKVLKGLEEQILHHLGSAEPNESVVQALFGCAENGCARTRMCLKAKVGPAVEKSMSDYYKGRIEKDATFSPPVGDPLAQTEKILDYNKNVDYYKVLGVELFTPAKDFSVNLGKLTLLMGNPKHAEIVGLTADEAKNNMRQVTEAIEILSHEPTRLHYQYSRTRAMFENTAGLTKKKKEPAYFDGGAFLVAFEDEVVRLEKKMARSSKKAQAEL
eukprot:TRINITY_DN19120_c0_g1_i1.p1 TRINITY_DN19120_c0_g1~~TRINITY_DN19120_c0_g1_i1.p1  ORF type:complete len:380 (+),score=70.91 TRINITY_DN19120_c0_g1_i1:47-1186(+)